MPEFENYAAEAALLETEIARKGIILGIDWDNEAQVRMLARQALACNEETFDQDCNSERSTGRARLVLFGLAQLMLKVMRQSAEDGMITHGGPVWKSFGRALWEEAHMSGEHK